MNNKNIVQTPSHLKLFDKVTNNDKLYDYRDGLQNKCNRNMLEKQFFSETNIRNLQEIIKKKLNIENISYEIITLVMTNLYTNNYQIYLIEEMNNLMITEGIISIAKIIKSNNIYNKDKNNMYTLMDRPILTSNKYEKQLPKHSFF